MPAPNNVALAHKRTEHPDTVGGDVLCAPFLVAPRLQASPV